MMLLTLTFSHNFPLLIINFSVNIHRPIVFYDLLSIHNVF